MSEQPEQNTTEVTDRTKAAQMSETALVKTEPALEKIKNVNANKMVLAAREANGRFGNRGLALANDTAKRIAKVAYTPDETGKTMVEQVAASQLTVARDNKDPRNLNAVAGLLETLDEITGQKMVRQRMLKEAETKAPIPKVVINIQLSNREVIDYEAQLAAQRLRDLRGPSFIDAEVVTQNPSPAINPWSGSKDRRHNPPSVIKGDRREAQKC